MAIYHLTAKTVSRGKSSAKARHDYIEREGRYASDKAEVEYSQSGNMPEWAQDARKYWDAADTYERGNGRLFKQLEFSLPKELTAEQQKELVYEARIDHRSLKEQGIDREPTQHLGPAAAAMERKGIQTDRGRQVAQGDPAQGNQVALELDAARAQKAAINDGINQARERFQAEKERRAQEVERQRQAEQQRREAAELQRQAQELVRKEQEKAALQEKPELQRQEIKSRDRGGMEL